MIQSEFTEATIDILNRKWFNCEDLRLSELLEGWGSEG